MVLYLLLFIIAAILYVGIGDVCSNLFNNPDMKAFAFVFWPLLIFYWILYILVSTIRRLVTGGKR